jgi:hypothetical protein
VLRYAKKNIWVWCLIAAIGVMAGVMNLILRENANPIVSENPSPGSVLSVADPIISNILLKLSSCESGNRSNIKVLDSNGKYSYGLYQFQLATFWGFGRKYDILPEDIEFQESENLIYDRDVQTEVATRMIEEGLLSFHWKMCYHKMDENTKDSYYKLLAMQKGI